MLNPDADRNLLFVLLALQMDFLDRRQLVTAMQPWMLDRAKNVGQLLVTQGALSEQRRELLANLVQEHIEQHGGDVESSIVTASAMAPAAPAVAAAAEVAEVAEVAGSSMPELSRLLEILDAASDSTLPSTLPGRAHMPEGPRTPGGRFRILELLGQGGLGQVMVARDEELGRTVVVKEIQPRYADDPAIRERFVLEAEVTGGLEHPCIVPVYGLGKYADGRPYYAMRFIRGEDLHKAIERLHGNPGDGWAPGRRQVELHQLLRHFIDLCNAVEYAHHRGVLHRDIKPANVMVGKFGETLVVDWGLAKVIGHSETENAEGEPALCPSSGSGSYPTVQGSAIGTPAYMSPEQAAGQLDELGPASDVYSLGATLYSILTGRPAFSGRLEKALNAVRTGDFPPPRQLQPQIPRPLEAICLKAMALSPPDRYGAPRDLATDLQRWIADESVSAYRESRAERLARWMRRHRTWVQAGTATLVAAATFFAVATTVVTRAWRNESTARHEEAAARQEAVANFRDARQAVDAWLTGLAQSLQYYPGTDKPRQRLLELAARDYEAFTRKRPGHRDLELERGRTYLRLGHLRSLQHDSGGAAEAYRLAARVFESLKRERPDDLEARVEWANCHTNQGLLCLAAGQPKEADRAYQTAIAELDDLQQRFPGHPLPAGALAYALSNRAEWLLDTGAWQEAESHLRKSVDLLTRPTAGEPDPASHQVSLVRAQDLLGRVLLKQGRYEQATAAMRNAVNASTALAGNAWDNPEFLDSRASTNVSLGTVLRETGDTEAEAVAYQLAAGDYRALAKSLPGAPRFSEGLALVQTNLGSLFYRLDRADEAAENLVEARQRLHGLAVEYPQIGRYSAGWAYCQGTLARVVRDRGRFEEARGMFEQAIQTLQEVLSASRETGAPVPGNYVECQAFCQVHLGHTLCLMNRHDEADAAFRAAVAAWMPLADQSPDGKDNLALIYEHWGNALEDRGQREESRDRFKQAHEIWTALVASATASADHRHNYARFLARCPLDDFRSAPAAIQIATELTRQRPKNAMYWNTLAVALYRCGDWRASVNALREAMEKRSKENVRDDFLLAMAKWQLEDEEESRAAYQRGVRLLDETLPHNPDLRRMQREAAEVLGDATE